MQAALSIFAGSAVQARVQRSSLAGRQLRGAVGNGARCRAFFKFGGGQKDKNGKERGYDSGVSIDAEYFTGEHRDDYQASDVQDYFMYMGMLASEGTYDRCEAMLASGIHPCDLLLLMACTEGDDGKVNELLEAGADPNVKDMDGRTPMELAAKEEVKELLRKFMITA